MTTALIVDDSLADLRMTGGLLEKGTGIQVSYASQGIEALKMLSEELSDILITDLQMPEMDGLELVESVR